MPTEETPTAPENGKRKRAPKKKKVVPIVEGAPLALRMSKLKHRANFFYDFQKLRIQAGNRDETDTVALDAEDLAFIEQKSEQLHVIETSTLKEIERMLRGIPIYERWLMDQRGVGVTLAAVLVSYINIERCNTVSQLWAWCGLAVRDGKADRRIKGQKCRYNPWLKSKMFLLGECLIKAGSPYRQFYDNYKHRQESRRVDVCMKCSDPERPNVRGNGRFKCKGPDFKKCRGAECPLCKGAGDVKCDNCEGTGGPAPYGNGKAHRHAMSLRYMVKMFLRDFWESWRRCEGLDIRPSYAEQYLGVAHQGPRIGGAWQGPV